MTQEEAKKELATQKRKISEIASKIHDIVEDTLWTQYKDLRPLSDDIIIACENYYAFKQEHGL